MRLCGGGIVTINRTAKKWGDKIEAQLLRSTSTDHAKFGHGLPPNLVLTWRTFSIGVNRPGAGLG
jgi:hypothetical protein